MAIKRFSMVGVSVFDQVLGEGKTGSCLTTAGSGDVSPPGR